MERTTGLEPATPCLGSRNSTTELRPHRAFGQIRTDALSLTMAALYHWSYEGIAGRPGLEPGKDAGPKPAGSACSPTAQWSPRRVLPPASRSYKERLGVGPRGRVRSAGVEPASTRPSTEPVYLIAARALKLAAGPGLEPWMSAEDAIRPCVPAVPSRHPVSNRTSRLTKAGPQPCAAAKLPIVDSNHEPPGPEPDAAARLS
jgi:hypothetical protein